MWALCNMLAVISSLCSPMFCQLVNLSWINWKVQNCVREADCCWNNLYFKCSIHIFWALYFQMASYKVQMLLAVTVQILCEARTWKDKYFPYHTSTEQIKIENSLGPFTVWRRGDSHICNICVKHDEQRYKNHCMLVFVGMYVHAITAHNQRDYKDFYVGKLSKKRLKSQPIAFHIMILYMHAS